MINDSGVETSAKQFGAKACDIDMLVNDVIRISFNEEGLFGSVPPLEKEDIKQIFELSL